METNNPRKAGAIILNNLAMFNEAAILMEQQIEAQIFGEIDNIIQQWITKNEWNGEAEWFEVENTWMSPKEWCKQSEQQDTTFAVTWLAREDEEESSYDVANLCDCGQTRLGFFFGRHDDIKKSAWKLKPASQEKYSLELEPLGFIETDDKYAPWFLPVVLDNLTLAKAYENDDYDEAMKPLRRALESIVNAQRVFDEVVKEIMSEI
ncbi:hypothetical protein HGB07_07470 [Candidatus Roizmanbacteria bacterium]|nr:hypothetical protein [Candidatus Roizmanbacteria bacterium]